MNGAKDGRTRYPRRRFLAQASIGILLLPACRSVRDADRPPPEVTLDIYFPSRGEADDELDPGNELGLRPVQRKARTRDPLARSMQLLVEGITDAEFEDDLIPLDTAGLAFDHYEVNAGGNAIVFRSVGRPKEWLGELPRLLFIQSVKRTAKPYFTPSRSIQVGGEYPPIAILVDRAVIAPFVTIRP